MSLKLVVWVKRTPVSNLRVVGFEVLTAVAMM
jgi:hypothetical protein